MIEWLTTIVGEQYAQPALYGLLALGALVLFGILFALFRRGGDKSHVRTSRRKSDSRARLAVIDAAPVDENRSLVLVRRDNTEHLILIGGPTDVVVESRIVPDGGNFRTNAAPNVDLDNFQPSVAQAPVPQAASQPTVMESAESNSAPTGVMASAAIATAAVGVAGVVGTANSEEITFSESELGEDVSVGEVEHSFEEFEGSGMAPVREPIVEVPQEPVAEVVVEPPVANPEPVIEQPISEPVVEQPNVLQMPTKQAVAAADLVEAPMEIVEAAVENSIPVSELDQEALEEALVDETPEVTEVEFATTSEGELDGIDADFFNEISEDDFASLRPQADGVQSQERNLSDEMDELISAINLDEKKTAAS